MNHYCTYFDGGFLARGLVLWQSLRQHDPAAVLWVLALDEVAAAALRARAEPDLRVVALAELEAGDDGLAAAKANRSRVEYYFTLSPCWPRWLLRSQPRIECLVYLDADLMFFASPRPVWDELARGSVLLCAHRFPAWLRQLERHGRYNVGVLGWRRDGAGLACLDWWRERCLEWCHDRLEPDRYADQKYLEAWPRLFAGVVECSHPGINLGPWNWLNHPLTIGPAGVQVDGRELVVFHFASLRRLGGRWWDSGQLEYGVMPGPVRQEIYGPYLDRLAGMETELARGPSGPALARPIAGRRHWRRWLQLCFFGAVWFRTTGGMLWSPALPGVGPRAGRWLARLRGEGKNAAA